MHMAEKKMGVELLTLPPNHEAYHRFIFDDGSKTN
jgi:hypothetical protein